MNIVEKMYQEVREEIGTQGQEEGQQIKDLLAREFTRGSMYKRLTSGTNRWVMKTLKELKYLPEEERELRLRKLSQMYHKRNQRLIFTAIAESELKRLDGTRFVTCDYRYLMEWWVKIGYLEQLELLTDDGEPVSWYTETAKRDTLKIFTTWNNRKDGDN